MKKISVLVLSVLLILSGCGKKDNVGNEDIKEPIKEEVKEEKKSIKKDDSIPEYSRIVEHQEYDYGGLNPDDLGGFISNVMRNTYGISEPQRNEKIVVNIDSSDAEVVNAELEQLYATSIAEVRYGDNGNLAQASGLVLLAEEESDTTVSIVVLNYGYILFSDGFSFETYAYVFDKGSGKLLSTDEIYQRTNTSIEDAQAQINEHLSSANLIVSQDTSGVYDPTSGKPGPAILNEKALYITTDGKLHVELHAYLGVGGAFPYSFEL